METSNKKVEPQQNEVQEYKLVHSTCPYGNDDCPKCNPKVQEVSLEYTDKDYRDDALANIFNSTENRADLYMGIIKYLVDVGFLQDGVQETSSEDIVENIMKEIKSQGITNIDFNDSRDIVRIENLLRSLLSSK